MKVFVILSAFAVYAAAHSYLLPLQVPDTPEVAAAKAQHYAAHVEAAARAGVPPPNPWAYAAVAGLAPGQDTPEVAHAKLQHAQAHAEARARNAIVAVVDPWAYSPWVAPGQAIPDTPEVAVAKIQHAQAHAEALARSQQ